MPEIVEQCVIDMQGLEDPEGVLRKIEHCGRTAYRTWDKETPGSAARFVSMIVKLGHESVLEHASVTVTVRCDRATAQQLTRHRIASFTMESQRYCNYSKERFGNAITFISPMFPPLPDGKPHSQAYARWEKHVTECERAYLDLIEMGCAPEDARSVLPNCTSCILTMTLNLREWRHVFRLRTDHSAQHNVRELCQTILTMMHARVPCVFDDIVRAP